MEVFDFEYARKYSYAKGDELCLVKDTRSVYQPMHRHTYYEIVYVHSGKGIQIINNTSYPVQPGSVMLFDPSDSHSFYATNYLSLINICFTKKDFLRHFPLQRFDIPVIALDEESQQEMENLLSLIASELEAKKTQYSTVTTLSLDWILLLIQRNCQNSLETDPVWGNVLVYISTDFKTATLEEAAKITNVSKSHFCRQFKKRFSMTFHSYLDYIRLQRAKYMLKFSDESIANISLAVGYNNVCRFYENFKKSEGITPHHWKKQNRSDL